MYKYIRVVYVHACAHAWVFCFPFEVLTYMLQQQLVVGPVTHVGFYCLLRRRRYVVNVVLMAAILLCIYMTTTMYICILCNDNNMCTQ